MANDEGRSDISKTTLVSSPGGSGTPPPELKPRSGATTGGTPARYKLLRKLGEGGMGEVWEAAQEAPVRRNLAVKVIKRGMDTADVVARFEAERQALAMMDHAGIAKVFDAGETQNGRPFFAMELVKGVPITQYCDTHQLDNLARLRLFRDVCVAVQHAHQKAIIHRDLKPSNILVTDQSGRPRPKIIDFGVAKATTQSLTDRTLYTQVGQVIGTPAYMSPEQAEMSAADVDTRTDVYSLGVVLYVLLTGVLPFSPKRLSGGSIDEMRRILREEDPPTPSANVINSGKSLEEAARTRRVGAGDLARSLKGDLDWIVMKALEKDRSRRYGSAQEFADDLQRHLSHEPVLARRAGAAYRFGKFIRRHRVGAAFATTAIIAAAAVTANSLYQADRVAAERDRANEQAAVAKQVSGFLVDLFSESDPNASKGKDVTARELLDRGAARIENDLADQPMVRAELTSTIGLVYSNVGLFNEAENLLRRAWNQQAELLGKDDPETLETQEALSTTLYRLAQYAEQDPIATDLLERRERQSGTEHPATIRAVESLGTLRLEQGRFDEADSYFQRQLAGLEALHGKDSEKAQNAAYNIAMIAFSQGRIQDAADMLTEVLAAQQRVLGEDDRTTINTKSSLGVMTYMVGDFKRAERMLAETLASRTEMLGPEHDGTLISASYVARVHREMGRVREALEEYVQLVDARLRLSGPDVPRTRSALTNLGDVLGELGCYDESLAILRAVRQAHKDVEGLGTTRLAQTEITLSRVLMSAGFVDEALRVIDGAVESQRGENADQRVLGVALRNRGQVLQAAGRKQQAETSFGEALDVLTALLPKGHPSIVELRGLWAFARDGATDSEISKELEDSYKQLNLVEGLNPNRLRRAALRLADFYAQSGEAELENEWLARAADVPVAPRECDPANRATALNLLQRWQGA